MQSACKLLLAFAPVLLTCSSDTGETNIVTYKYKLCMFIWFEHCSNRCGASCRCVSRRQVCYMRASIDKYAGCALCYNWRALHMVGIHDRQSDSTYTEGRKGPQAVLYRESCKYCLSLVDARHVRSRDANSLLVRLQAKESNGCNYKLKSVDGSRYNP